MGSFLVFLIKSTGCLTMFYLFYRLLLARETFHRFNRMALLGVILLSTVIPFVRMTVNRAANEIVVKGMGEGWVMDGLPVEEGNVFSTGLAALFVVYLGGCLFFAGRFLYSLWQVAGLIRSGEVSVREDGTRLVVTDRPVPPFSFMSHIVISRIDMEESGREILMHEQAHIRAWHSLDMWLAGYCTILHWFNPAAWLLKQELQNVHEYEADESVITQGVDARHYQLLLIKKAVGVQRFTSLANSFSHSKLKKRITMMLKQRSNPWARLKYLYVLPLAAVTVAVFARPDVSHKLEKISGVEFAEAMASPQKKKDILVIGYDSMKQQNENVYGFAKKNDTLIGPLDLSVKSDRRTVLKIRPSRANPLIILDGEEFTGSMDEINPETIESITVMKDEAAQKLYGEKAAEGVILIQTKKTVSVPDTTKKKY